MINVETIAIAGFKSFGAEVTIPLRPINLLIGANGSGKSNFLNAFAFLQAFSSGQLDEFVVRGGGADQFLHFGSRTTEQMTISTRFTGSDGYEFQFRYDGRDNFLWTGMPRLPDMGDKRRDTRKRFDSWRCHHFPDTGFHSPMKKNLQAG